MKTTFIKYSLLTAMILFCASSCKKKDPPAATNSATTGKVKMEFFNKVGPSSDLSLNNQWYINENGDSFTVSKFNYYISNIILTGPNGASYTESNSYHLLQQSDLTSLTFDMTDIPATTYDSVSFLVGVDELHNTSGAQTGALDPLNAMFWDWNTGYIMLKLEGHSPQAPGGNIAFHCGGFTGRNSAIRYYKLPLTPITVSANGTPHVHVKADVLAMFKSPNKIDFSTLSVVTTAGDDVKKLADNYANMFTITYSGL